MPNNNNRAARGESGLSSLEKGDTVRGNGAETVAAESQAPVVEQSWDPYQVWLTRVKQPREQSARKRKQPRAVAEQSPAAPDVSDAARLRALTIVR